MEKSDEEIVAALASALRERRLTTPAILLLELFKPLSFIGSQLLFVAAPILPLPGSVSHRRYARFFEERQNIESLLQALQQ